MPAVYRNPSRSASSSPVLVLLAAGEVRSADVLMTAGSQLIASLPMYDLPELRPATDRLWAAIGGRLGLNFGLSRGGDYVETWRDPSLVFGQTCGYPFTHAFRGQLKLVATPHYEADGCDGPRYRSILFAREPVSLESLRGCRAAFNNRDSMSGMLALKAVFAPLARKGEFFSAALETGSHVASLAALQEARADVAAIDCVTVALLRKVRPAALAGLHEIARSPLVPALPYVTRTGSVTKLRHALADVFADADMNAARQMLLLSGHSVLTEDDYDNILRLEHDAEAKGGLLLW